MSESTYLGACCGCEEEIYKGGLIICLPWRCGYPGRGWGCLQCGLSMDGAIVVLCAECGEQVELGRPYEEICVDQCHGFPATDGRDPFDPLKYPSHRHDMSRHPEADPNDPG